MAGLLEIEDKVRRDKAEAQVERALRAAHRQDFEERSRDQGLARMPIAPANATPGGRSGAGRRRVAQ